MVKFIEGDARNAPMMRTSTSEADATKRYGAEERDCSELTLVCAASSYRPKIPATTQYLGRTPGCYRAATASRPLCGSSSVRAPLGCRPYAAASSPSPGAPPSWTNYLAPTSSRLTGTPFQKHGMGNDLPLKKPDSSNCQFLCWFSV